MKPLSFLIIASLFCATCLAQRPNSPLGANFPTKTTSNYARIGKKIPSAERFRFDAFSDGKVLYSAGKATSGNLKLNYDKLYKRILALGENGDTLLVNEFEEIKYVEIGSTLYFHDLKHGFVEIVNDPNEPVRLAWKPSLFILETHLLREGQKPVPGLNSGDRLSVLIDETIFGYPVRQVVLMRSNEFFLIDADDHLWKASRKAFLKIFHTQRRAIVQQMSKITAQHVIRYNRREDVEEVLTFCKKITGQ